MTHTLSINCLRMAAVLALAVVPTWPQAAEISDAICISCHAEPGRKFHSQPSHKKLACTICHLGGAEHVADTRVRPKLGGNERLCASCHEAKKKHGDRD